MGQDYFFFLCKANSNYWHKTVTYFPCCGLQLPGFIVQLIQRGVAGIDWYYIVVLLNECPVCFRLGFRGTELALWDRILEFVWDKWFWMTFAITPWRNTQIINILDVYCSKHCSRKPSIQRLKFKRRKLKQDECQFLVMSSVQFLVMQKYLVLKCYGVKILFMGCSDKTVNMLGLKGPQRTSFFGKGMCTWAALHRTPCWPDKRQSVP